MPPCESDWSGMPSIARPPTYFDMERPLSGSLVLVWAGSLGPSVGVDDGAGGAGGGYGVSVDAVAVIWLYKTASVTTTASMMTTSVDSAITRPFTLRPAI